MMTCIIEPKTLGKHIPSQCKCKCDETKYKSSQTCDEVIEPCNEEIKTIQTNFNEIELNLDDQLPLYKSINDKFVP